MQVYARSTVKGRSGQRNMGGPLRDRWSKLGSEDHDSNRFHCSTFTGGRQPGPTSNEPGETETRNIASGPPLAREFKAQVRLSESDQWVKGSRPQGPGRRQGRPAAGLRERGLLQAAVRLLVHQARIEAAGR